MKQDMVMTGFMGLSGTEELIQAGRGELEQFLPLSFLEEAQRLASQQRKEKVLVKEAVQEEDCIRVWEIGPEGLMNGLWYLSREWKTGFAIQKGEIPVKQETIEVCEILNVNPYQLDCDGCLLIAAANGGRLCRHLAEKGIWGTVIGELTDTKDCVFLGGETVSYLNRPEQEELTRFLEERKNQIR